MADEQIPMLPLSPPPPLMLSLSISHDLKAQSIYFVNKSQNGHTRIKQKKKKNSLTIIVGPSKNTAETSTAKTNTTNLYGWELLKVSQHPAKYGEHKHYASEDIFILVRHVDLAGPFDQRVL